MAGGKGSATKVKLAERRNIAIELRKSGLSYRAIATEIRLMSGMPPRYSEAMAYRDVTSELQRLNEKSAEVAKEVRRLELERLDALTESLWDMAIKGDNAAIDRLLRISERRARLLGLDAPRDVNLTGDMALTIEYVIDDESYKEAEEEVSS